MKAWKKIDKYYPLLIFVLIVLAGLTIYTFRSVFSAIFSAYEVETKIPDSELIIDKDKLDEAESLIFEKEIVPLNAK